MQCKSLHPSALILSAMLGCAMTPSHAQTFGNGPYYATPSWDQTLPVNTRFIVLANMGNEAVLDRETGLVWERVPRGPSSNWSDASGYCVNLSKGGRQGWRLPTIQELSSIIDPTRSPSVPSGAPLLPFQSFYWSATTKADDTSRAWFGLFSSGIVADEAKSRNDGVFIPWCVRGGQGVDPQ
jgi:Protein of unknown function (DUF1566)